MFDPHIIINARLFIKFIACDYSITNNTPGVISFQSKTLKAFEFCVAADLTMMIIIDSIAVS